MRFMMNVLLVITASVNYPDGVCSLQPCVDEQGEVL